MSAESEQNYATMAPMPNKFLNPDGTTSTLSEAMGGGAGGGGTRQAAAGFNFNTPGALQLNFGDFTVRTESFMGCSPVTNIKLVNNGPGNYFAMYSDFSVNEGSYNPYSDGPVSTWLGPNSEAQTASLTGREVYTDGHITLFDANDQSKFVADFSYRYQQHYSCSDVNNVLIVDKAGV